MTSSEFSRALVASTGKRGRDLFALDPRVRHLNHGSYGASPRAALDHQAALKATLESNPMRWFEELPPRHAAVRQELAAYLHTTADTLAWVPNASAAATIVFSSLDLGPGDEVVLTDHAYGAVAMGVERFVTRRGGRVVRVEVPLAAEADETAEAILAAVGPRTRAVVLDQISSATARLFPVDEIARRLDGTGSLLVIDGAHGLGILERPLVDGDHVIWFGNLHKYACGPRGSAVLSARGEVAQTLWPSIDSWGAGDPFPARFDLQGSVDSTAFLSSATAISTMEALFGWDRIRAHSTTLGGYGADLLADALSAFSDDDPRVPLGMRVPQQPLVRLPTGVARDGTTARALKDAFAAAGFEIGVSTFRGRGYIRVSAHAYSEAEEFEELADRGIEVVRRAADEARAARP